MKELFTTQSGRFRMVAALEGISFILLLGIAMPLKYVWGQPWMVQSIGMAHGLLFVLYLLGVAQIRNAMGWSLGQTALAMVMSAVPFGTFYVTEKMMRRNSSPQRKTAGRDGGEITPATAERLAVDEAQK